MSKNIIEFIGLPGAGKTTIVQYLMEQDCFKELGCTEYKNFIDYYKKRHPRYETRGYKLYILAINIPLLISLISFRLRFGKLDVNALKRIASFVISQSRMRKAPNFIIQDQGLIQSLASIVMPNEKGCTDFKLPKRIIYAIQKNLMGIVHIKLDSALSMTRINNRPDEYKGSRADKLNSLEQVKFIKDFEDALNGIHKHHSQNSKTSIITLEGVDTIEKKSRLIYQWLLGMIN